MAVQNSNAKELSEEPRFLRLPEVEFIVGKKRSTIYRDIESGSFPAPYKLGSGKAKGRSVGWRLEEIRAWVSSRPRAELRHPPEES